MTGVKCIVRAVSCLLAVTMLLTFGGCSSETGSYDIYQTSYEYGLVSATASEKKDYLFSATVCPPSADIGTDQVTSQVAQGAGVFNTATRQTLYAQNISGTLSPASTPQLLTLYVALKYGKLDQEYTVSERAVDQASDSSVCNLAAGDVLTLRQLLYGMMLRSGNDAAVAIAEAVSGDVETFVALMNREALALGATHSHFVNPNGLHDDNHYTTVYDMYLILQEAVKNPAYQEILCTTSYDAVYRGADGQPKEQQWATTNRYLLGYEDAPEGITVLGGKTGTTGKAKYCLVLFSRNQRNEPIISIVFGADGRSNLYLLMSQILTQFGNM